MVHALQFLVVTTVLSNTLMKTCYTLLYQQPSCSAKLLSGLGSPEASVICPKTVCQSNKFRCLLGTDWQRGFNKCSSINKSLTEAAKLIDACHIRDHTQCRHSKQCSYKSKGILMQATHQSWIVWIMWLSPSLLCIPLLAEIAQPDLMCSLMMRPLWNMHFHIQPTSVACVSILLTVMHVIYAEGRLLQTSSTAMVCCQSLWGVFKQPSYRLCIHSDSLEAAPHSKAKSTRAI